MSNVTYQPPQPDPYGQPPQSPAPQYAGPPPGYPPQQPYPPAPPRKKKGGAGKVALIVLAALVVVCGGLIAIVAAATGSSKPGTGGGAPAAVHASLNQPARDGKFEFTVTAIKCGVPKVGDGYLNKTAQGQYCLVTVKVSNIGTVPQLFDGSGQKAHDAAGTTFANDGQAEGYANKDSATFLNEINPGNSVVGTLVFDIPKTAAIKTLELHDSLFSGGVIVTVA